ncbi:branched-chain amino acid transporter permease [Trueperella bialowiezensis]|uniref:Branched-chain amino acid transport protein (AzlD) n=1 Tax=Trueperella bialowiezensis TaxID=312285 RepID=A0A448PGJ0_9ACTO|nr:AzlD domain-containing protein [Trueperella bialowiezensis]VEI14079.1 Branched-chain amino acid transport protein (AzlD) [Trueperella bialowiezensis]
MTYILTVTVTVWAITYGLRAAPFVFLAKVRDSQTLAYLGRTMPAGVMAILVVFSLRDITFASAESWVPAAVGVVATCCLHLAFRKVLVSLLGGTGAFALALAMF